MERGAKGVNLGNNRIDYRGTHDQTSLNVYIRPIMYKMAWLIEVIEVYISRLGSHFSLHLEHH